MSGLERLWAGWRNDYVSDPKTGRTDTACVICNLVAATDDVEALVLERTPETITVLNLYPYGSGHLMVAPTRHAASLEDLDDDELIALSRGQVRALRAVRAAYSPDGVNLGVNIGRAAGAGVPTHLHVHVLPRWSGDTNFMTTVAEVRVLPESLGTAYDKLKAVWPG
jgi:ATP adenylyltransferase